MGVEAGSTHGHHHITTGKSMSGRASGHELLFDAAAESLIMFDPAEGDSIAELVERLVAIADWFGDGAADEHPSRACVSAARRLERGDVAAMHEVETAFGAARTEADRLMRDASKEPAAAKRRAAAPPPARASEPASPAAAAAAPSAAMPLAGDEELLLDFAVRAAEHLDDADERLLALEVDPSDPDAIDAVFRAFHTIKGMAGFLALDAISELAHDTESLLAEPRKTGSAVDERSLQTLFSAVDRMRALVAAAAGLSAEPVEDPSTADADADGDRPVAKTPQATDSGAVPANSSAMRTGSVRVEEGRLDSLLDAIGEMVIAESMVSASTRGGTDAAVLEAQIERLDKITRELQQMATSLRMVPLRATFRRMARLVRDVANKAGKDVEFVLSGEDTELDKIVVDRISDPLVHALRNAVDHGIESPEERIAAGKPTRGRVELRAFHAGGAIHVEIVDDGRGVNAEAVLKRARERGLLGEDERPDERALFDILFAPGFSTAEQVTDVSGRGVGMDVVKRTVEELRGRIDLRSRAGEGTTLEIRLPLTLAIIDGMTLRVGEERYVVPLLSILRSVRPTAEQITSVVGRGEMLSLDAELVPVIRLHRLFGTTGAETDLTKAVVVIVDDNGAHAGLVACELLGQQQTVIKPLGEGLPDQPGVAGGAIMPDGRVGLILDAAGLVRHAQRGAEVAK
jgi:two-component system, chemotaxis family, sensor kinase CheA